MTQSVAASAITAVLLTGAVLGAGSPPPPPDAVSILRNAEKAARANPDPQYIVYDMHEIFVHHGKQFTFDYHVWYRADGKGLMQNAAKDRAGNHEQRFGYPFPSSPDANFLLYATPPPTPAPTSINLPSPGPSGATAPPLIGIQAITANRYYSVSLVGTEDYQGHSAYHLALLPLTGVDEKSHPWKDLWVDTNTFEIWKAHARANGSKGPATGALEATIQFEPVGPYWMISQASGDGEVHLGFISDSGHYEYYFSGFDFPDSLPDWYFDPGLFRHH
jgi:hypothetical protein